MRKKFDNKLKQLNNELIDMANLIQSTIKEAMEVFFKSDIDEANKIIKNDQEINDYQKRIENICYSIIINNNPLAKDLR